MAVRGDLPTVIQWTGGHSDFKTTQGYIARGQTERQRGGNPLPALPSGIAPNDFQPCIFPFSLGNIATPTGIEVCHSNSRNMSAGAVLADNLRE